MLNFTRGLRSNSVFVSLLMLGTALLAVQPARAQSGNASLSLSVLDPQGLAVSAAAVTVESPSTGFRRRQIAGEDGVCLFPLLPPGEYNVTVEAEDFSPARLEGVRLNVNQQGRQNVSMSLAAEAATVTVEAPPPLLESATVAQVVDRQFVGNLPLNGRSFQSLIALGPGIVNVAASSNSPGQFSVNGQRPNSNYFMVDGVSATFGTGASFIPSAGEDGSAAALTAFGGTNSLVSVDAMQEFEVQTSTFAPEYGRMPGAQISIVTRSGTNDFHGTLFHYFRNEVLDANDWFANRDSLPKPQMRQNNFGGVLGGPIVSNRTFFFGSYEGLRLRQPQFSTAAYPAMEARANAAPELLPAVRAFPVPQLESLNDGLARFAATYSNPSSLDATSLRIDHRFSDSVSLFGRYNHAPSSIEVRGGPGFRDLSLNTISTTSSGNQTLTLGPSWVIAPNLLNDLRFNWSRSTALLDSVIDDFGGAEVPPESVLFPPFSSPKTGVVGLYLLNTAGYALGVSADNAQNQINIVDTLAYIVGRHEVKVGFDYRRLTPAKRNPDYRQTIAFRNLSGRGGLLSGVALQNVIEIYDPSRLAFENFSLFVQDAWRASTALTLTYGVRWDYNPAPSALGGKQLHSVANADDPARVALGGAGEPLYDAPKNAVAPRLGVAWTLHRKNGWELTARGGAGLFYDLPRAALFSAFFNPPLRSVQRLLNAPYPLPLDRAGGTPLGTQPPFDGLLGFTDNFRMPLTRQWNLTLEQGLGSGRTLSVAYIGSAGRRLPRLETQSRPNAEVNFANIYRTAATSDYHALQTRFRQPLRRGVQAMASYTWSHSIDSASDNVVRFFSVDVQAPEVNRGSSSFDVRHVANGAVVWEIPGPESGGGWRHVFRDWAVDGMARLQTAFPVDPYSGVRTVLGSFNLRPDLVPGQPVYLESDAFPGGRALNRAAFQPPPGSDLRQGTLGRNVLRGFGAAQFDLSLRREIALREGFRLQLRGDFFNLTNTPSFAAPVNNLRSPLFGMSSQSFNQGLGQGGASGGQNPLYSLGGPRSVQLALKLLF